MIHRSFSLGVQVTCDPSWLCGVVGTVASCPTVPVILPWVSGGIACPVVALGCAAAALELLGDRGWHVCALGTSCSQKPGTGAEIREQSVNDRGAYRALRTPCKRPATAAPSYSWMIWNCWGSADLPRWLSNPCCAPTPLNSQVLFPKFQQRIARMETSCVKGHTEDDL